MIKQNEKQSSGKFGKVCILVLVFLLLANIFVLAIYIYETRPSTIRTFENPFPFIDPARSFIGQEHFFSTIEPLRKELKRQVAEYEAKGNRLGVYFEFLNTGANVSINQDSRFWPASLSKMPTVFAVMKKVEEGEWKLSNELVLFYEDKDDRFGDLYREPVGTRFTIEELLKRALINSDNTAHRILVRNLSGGDYDAVFEALGMEELYDENYDITAKEYSRIFRALFGASYLNRENSEKILKWLSQTDFGDLLGKGVPDKIVFSHKIGEEHKEKVFLDSGIVYVPNRPYLITVMVEVVENGGFEQAGEIMRGLSKAAYEYVANN